VRILAALTGAELQAAFIKAKLFVRDKAKLAGAPLYYMHNGKRIREDVDGSKYVVVIDSNGNLTEYKVD
jgi:hypothetical protein